MKRSTTSNVLEFPTTQRRIFTILLFLLYPQNTSTYKTWRKKTKYSPLVYFQHTGIHFHIQKPKHQITLFPPFQSKQKRNPCTKKNRLKDITFLAILPPMALKLLQRRETNLNILLFFYFNSM